MTSTQPAAAEPPAHASPEPDRPYLQQLTADITEILGDYNDLEFAQRPVDLQVLYLEDQAREDANRLLWILAQVEAEQTVCKRELEAEVERIKMRHRARQERLSRRASSLTIALEHLFRFLPIRGKAKSLTLLRGKLGRRQATHAGLVITDEPAVIAWAKAHCPAAVTTVPAYDVLDRDVLKRTLLARVEAKQGLFVGKEHPIDGIACTDLEAPDQDGTPTPIVGLFYKPPVDAFYASPSTEE